MISRTCLFPALAALLFVTGSQASAQTSSSAPTPAPTSPAVEASTPASAEKEYDAFEFTEDELPKYDEQELLRLIHYPEDARSNGLEGLAVISFVVDATGHAVRLEAIQSDHLLFSEAAVDAISRLTFTPAYHKGKPVLVRMTIPVRFALSD